MLFVSDYDFPEPIRSILLILKLITGIGLVIIAIISYLYVRDTPSDEKSKNYLMGISMFFLILACSKAVYFYHDFFALDEWDTVLSRIADSIFLIGFVIFTYMIERHVFKKSKYVFTIIGALILVLYIIIWVPLISTIILYIGLIIMITLPLIIHIFIAVKGSGDVKKRALIITLGIVILMFSSFGLFLFKLLGLMSNDLSLLIGPPIELTGYIVLAYGLITMVY